LKFISLFFLFAIILLANVTIALSQSKSDSFGSVSNVAIKPDTIKNKKPTKGKKSSATSVTKSAPAVNDTTKKSQADLESELHVVAEDSTIYVGDVVYLYGKARVTYVDFELDADYIRVDKKNHLIFARGSNDPKTGRYTVARPISKQKGEDPLLSDSLIFNYETKKGLIYNPSSKQQENYLTHGQVKKLNENEAALRNVIYTTCDKDDPDYGIVITRGIVEKKQIITGPVYLEIEGIPIPIGLPFAFFPKQDSRSSGVILPTFGEDGQYGFYLRNFGYYIGLSDYADLTTTGTYYTNGSFELNSIFDYKDRYKYNGNLSLSYSTHFPPLQGDPPNHDFNVTWSHSQNPNAHPGSTFSASVNAGTGTFAQHNATSLGYNPIALTNNNLRSSIAYAKTWAGTPFNLTVSLSHSQDISKKTITLDLPTFNFSMSTISPFDPKDRVGEQKWYQKITVGYTLTGDNKLTNIPESQLFQSATFSKKLQNGLQHTIPVSLSLNVLKYFQFNTSVNYMEQWYFQTIREHFARADSLVTDTVPGFRRAGEYSVSTGFSTKVYGLVHFKSGIFTAIRHVMTPNISFNYRPDYTGFDNSYNKSIVSNATVPYPVVYQRYSIFANSIYGGPQGGKSAGLSLSLDNTLEAKLRPKSTDTSKTERKIWILQGLSFGTFYNFAADSMRLSPITFSGHTSFLHDKLNVSFGGSFNPYETIVGDSISGGHIMHYARPINRYSLQDGRFPMLTSFNVTASISLNPQVFRPQVQPVGSTLQNLNAQQAQKLALLNSDQNAYVDFNVPYNISLNYSFNYTNNVTSTSNSNTLGITGDLSLTPKWKITYTTNFDLRALKVAGVPSFTLYRNLHCWNLSGSWVPFGYYKSYSITLRVNSAVLQDLKLSKKSDYTANQYYTQ
jgi:hypothetical protein